jgi:hypothetical protein
MTEDLIGYHIRSARCHEKKDFQHARVHYLEAIKFRRMQMIQTNLNFDHVEYYALMTEYLSFLTYHFISLDIAIARKLALLSIKFLGNAKRICTDKQRQKDLAETEQRELMRTIDFFGCILPENNLYYTIKCPIIIRGRIGTNKVSPTVIYRSPKCSICNKSFLLCEHREGVKYGEDIAFIQKAKVEILDVALVDNPDFPDAKIQTLYLPKKSLESNIEPERLKEKKGAGLYCYHCKVTRFIPKEITTDLFFEMQKEEKDDEEKYDNEDNIPIKLRTFLFQDKNGFDPKSALNSPLVLFKENGKFKHIPSNILDTKPKQE